ncbi:MAG: DUF6364 family protein [Bacteroidota bacterium]
MDAKVTLSFDQEVIRQAKEYAQKQNISLSRLTEFLLRQVVLNQYPDLEQMPIASWVQEVAEGKVIYGNRPKSRNDLKEEFYNSKKSKK